MKFKFLLITLSFVGILNAQLTYPKAKQISQVDTYFNHPIADPYRWLEDDNSTEAKAWVEAENKLTQSYLGKIPFKAKFYQRLEKVYNYPKYSAPFQKGDWIYWNYNDGLKNQSSIYRLNLESNKEELILDPNTLSHDGTVGVKQFSLNKDGTLAGIGINEGGSDWQVLKVLDINTKQFLKDEIQWVKFGKLAWYGNGFYYSRYPEVDKSNSKLSAENKYNQVYYHIIGTSQSEDKLIYETKNYPNRSFYPFTTDDEHYLFIAVGESSTGKRGNALLMKDLTATTDSFISIVDSITDYSYWITDVVDKEIFITTNENAPNNKVISISAKKPQIKYYNTIIPEGEYVIDDVVSSGNKLFVQYLENVATKTYIYDYNGKPVGDIAYPTFGTASNVNKNKNCILYYTFNSFGTPPTIYSYNMNSGKSEVFKQSAFKGKTDDIMTERVFYTSKDGTKIPMFIVFKKGTTPNGKNPTLLHGYGGFNVAQQPNFNPTLIPFLESGGIYALACLRGGGEYGEKWHQAGTKLKKQNVFNDFIAAAEYLIEKKYTSSKYLAIRGGSNGGLLIGAVANQRPELFRVAIPMVGVMDMLRFHKFTIGKSWISDYGSSEIDETHFLNLRNFSPLHNIGNKSYPSMLITTADHDDRVVPAHSFKYAAALQEKYKGKRPMLIRIDTKSGHGASNTKKMLELNADVFSFIFYEMGVTPKL